MNIDNSIFEVSRAEYQSFVEQIKPECRKIITEQLDKWYVATKIFSVKTNKCLCSRITFTGPEDLYQPEKYMIFEMPDDEERLPPIPKIKLVLTNKEEVQKFFDYLAQQNKGE